MDLVKPAAQSRPQSTQERNTIADEIRITPSGSQATRDELAIMRRVLELLREGITAAQSGNRETARELLLDAATLDPDNELAWLWLSGLADSPEEAAAHLQRVLLLNPDHPHAREGMIVASMQAGVVAATSGLHALARHHFRTVLEINPEMEEAWLRLASVCESFERALICVHEALALNPDSVQARRALEWIQQQAAAEEAGGWQI